MPKVIFDGYVPQVRSIELTTYDLGIFKSAFRQFALDAIEHRCWDGPYHPPQEGQIIELCEKFGVDYTHKKDRTAFVNALVEFI